MARQRLNNNISDNTKKFEKPGDSISGNYLGSRTATTTFGECLVHSFSTPQGVVDCWGSTALDRGLEAVVKQAPGAMVWAVFKGKLKIGNKTLKSFDIDWDPDDCVDVNSILQSSGQDTNGDDEDDADDDTTAERPIAGGATITASNVEKANKLLQSKRNEKTA